MHYKRTRKLESSNNVKQSQSYHLGKSQNSTFSPMSNFSTQMVAGYHVAQETEQSLAVWQPNAPAILCDVLTSHPVESPTPSCGRVVVFISRVWYSDPTYRGTRGRRADGSRADGGAGGLAGLSSSSSSSSPPSANTARQRSRAYCAVHTEGLNAMPSTFPRLKWNKPKLHYGYQAREKWGKQMWIRPSSEFFTRRHPPPLSQHGCMHVRTESITPVFKGRIRLHRGNIQLPRDRKRPRS